VWKLHGLLESVILDKGPQFAEKLTKDLNKMLGIEMKLLTPFIYKQIEKLNKLIRS